jgi:hypothetical protein
MKIGSRETYIRRDFEFYDSGIIGCLPSHIFDIYDVLRRHVWKGRDGGNNITNRLWLLEGKVATNVSLEEVAQTIGCSRKIVFARVELMEVMRWLTIDGSEKTATYVLGNIIEGTSRPGFFADPWMQDLWEHICETAQQELGEYATGTHLPWERRREICTDWINGKSKLINY